MAKISTNKITSLQEDWGSDSRNGLPYSGQAVQDFIKEGIATANAAYSGRAGASYFDPSLYTQYFFKDEQDKDEWLSGGSDSLIVSQTLFNFTGTISQVRIINLMNSSNLFFTTAQPQALITVGFLSQEKGLTETDWEEVAEDFIVTVSVDKGATGRYQIINGLENTTILNGNTLTFDVKNYIQTGSNRVRVSAKGAITGETSNLIFQVTQTTMYLTAANFTWYKPVVEGSTYRLGGMYIGGSIPKTLKIHITGNGYDKQHDINIGTTISTNIPYYVQYDPNSAQGVWDFPTTGTGVYHFDIWLDAEGLESDHLHYDMLCIAKDDVNNAKYVIVNEVSDKAMNGTDSKLFSYALYNNGATTSDVSISVVVDDTEVIHDDLSDAKTGIAIDYVANVEYETEISGLPVIATITSGNTKTVAMTLDNSAAYPPISGAQFYLNASSRNNTQPNREAIVNDSTLEGATKEYGATWTNISFIDGMDGWTVDPYGRKCLLIPATSKVEIDYAPFVGAQTKSIELAMRVMNAADYNEDVVTAYAADALGKFVGLKIKPTNIVLHSNLLNTDDKNQSYNIKDEEFVHILITIVKDYKAIGNLAQIYVNGVKKCSFEWTGGDSFANNGKLIIGSETADICVYKIRVYDSPFEWMSVAQNFISCLPDAESKKAVYNKMISVTDNANIDYDTVVKNGYNYFTVELPAGKSIPSKLNDTEIDGSILTVNIKDNPSATINGVYEDVTTEGQGTTAMTYFRWNLRWKTDVIRITAKKNVASSMHSHKMGATSLFNDLNIAIIGENEANGRVAVYQYPAYGFQKILVDSASNRYVYEPIGLYTIGPDKGDKPTFGFNNKEYKSTLIHMEGVDHTPQGVGMDYPWSQMSVETNKDGDTSLGAIRADGKVNPAWEIGACGSAETDAEMLAYLEQEFKPAYECDYLNTSMIVGLPSGTSINDINNNLVEFRATNADNGFTYADCLIWIDGEYDTYYYSLAESKYVKDGVNILTDLGINTSDLKGTTVEEKNNEIRALRKERYRANMENYWHLRDSLFHYCFVLLLAATDNYKKNTYPYKFGTLASGSRWRWRQDDLDTLFDINNLGIADKLYSIMNGDKSAIDNAQLYKGNSSYHWRNIQEYYPNEVKSMMLEILHTMEDLCPSDYGTSPIEKVIGCVRYYFWDKAQNYFPISAYNIDAEWTYEDAWAVYKNNTSVNSVHPLRQSLGSHEEAERAWVELRVIYIASMYGFGAFANYDDITLGQLNFRPSGDNVFNITPAIDMNPTIVSGQSAPYSAGERIKAGETATITVPAQSSADTSIYVQATDYIRDLGDLKDVQVNNTNPEFSISGKRLQRIKVGDADASAVTTNLTNLTVGECPSVSLVDARNVSGLTGSVDLSKCPRLKQALFGGSSASEIILPEGSKIEVFDLPATLKNLSLVNLPKLSEITFDESTGFTALTYLRVENNAQIGGYALLKAALTEDGQLNAIRVIGFDYDGDSTDIQLLTKLANGGYFGINEKGEIDTNILPVLEGTINLATANQTDVDLIGNKFPTLTLNVDKIVNYIIFEDPEVERICAENWGDGTGITQEQVEAVTDIGTVFKGNTVIETFDEFEKFKGVTMIDSTINSPNNASFYKCSNLRSITLHERVTRIGFNAFRETGLTIISGLGFVKIINDNAFHNTTSLVIEDLSLPNLESLGQNAFYGVSIKKISNLGKITALPDAVAATQNFGKKDVLEEVVLPEGMTSIGDYGFFGYSALKTLTSSQLKSLGRSALEGCGIENFDFSKIETIGNYALKSCPLVIEDLKIPNLTSLGQNALTGNITRITDLGSITSLPYGGSNFNTSAPNFGNRSTLKSIVVPETVTSFEQFCLYGYNSMDYMICKPTVPPTLGIGALTYGNISTNSYPIYVPDASVEAYKQATNWSAYADRIMSMFYYLGYIDFADSAVRDICVANFDTDADGVVSMEEAAAVTDIGTLFKGNTKITSFDELKYFTGVTSLVENAFSNCSKLQSIDLTNITRIERSAFNVCNSLPEVIVLHENISFIGYFPFAGNTSIKKVYYYCRTNTASASNFSFSSMHALQKFYFMDTAGNYNNDYTSYPFFANCENLNYVRLSSNMTIIPARIFKNSVVKVIDNIDHITTINYEAFYNCTTLPSKIEFKSVTTIMSGAFSNSSFKSILFTSTSLSIIGKYNGWWDGTPGNVFINSTNLSILVILSDVVATLNGSNNFTGTPIESGTGFIYVPDNLVEDYKVANNWSTYADQIKPINVADTLPDISTVAENDLYKIGDVYWKAELVDEVLTWVEI